MILHSTSKLTILRRKLVNIPLIILFTCRIISYVFKKYESAIKTTDKNIAHGAHERIYSSVYFDNTIRISHSPFISTNHIIKSTIHLLENCGLKQVVGFKLSSNSWVRLNFTSNNEQRHTAKHSLDDFLF